MQSFLQCQKRRFVYFSSVVFAKQVGDKTRMGVFQQVFWITFVVGHFCYYMSKLLEENNKNIDTDK